MPSSPAPSVFHPAMPTLKERESTVLASVRDLDLHGWTLADGLVLGPKLRERENTSVYEAWQSHLGRWVEVEVVEARARREASSLAVSKRAETLGRLSHPGIPLLHLAGRRGLGRSAFHFLVLEKVDGRPFLEVCRLRHGDDQEARRLAVHWLEACRALEHALQRGVTHGRLDEDRVRVGPSGVKILGFGNEDSIVSRVPLRRPCRAERPAETASEPRAVTADLRSLGRLALRAMAGAHPLRGLAARLASVATKLLEFPALHHSGIDAAKPDELRLGDVSLGNANLGARILGEVILELHDLLSTAAARDARAPRARRAASPLHRPRTLTVPATTLPPRNSLLDPGSHSGATGHPLRIGEHRVERLLGEGEYGRVYLAIDEACARKVAIKIAHRWDRPSEAARNLQHEARILARLRHPGLVPVHSTGVHHDGGMARPYFVMDWVDGMPWTTALARSSDEGRLEILRSLCDLLEHVHGRGFVHGDLRPANLLVEHRHGVPCRVYLLDFGRALPRRSRASPDATLRPDLVALASIVEDQLREPVEEVGMAAIVRQIIRELGAIRRPPTFNPPIVPGAVPRRGTTPTTAPGRSR